MSRKGNCWDNAVAESFFKSLKTEWVYKHKYNYRAQDELSVFSWIETWYNKRILHLQTVQIIDLYTYINQKRTQLINQYNIKVNDELVFSTNGKCCKNVFSRLSKSMNIRTNTIRKSVIVNWLKQHDLRHVQYLSGHKYISSTENYITHNLQRLKHNVILHHPF